MAVTYFYCSDHGTRTTGGGTTTKRTGAFSSMAAGDVYRHPGIAVADSSPPVAGDLIVWDNANSDNIDSDTEVLLPSGVTLLAADTNNCDQYQKATSAQMTQASGFKYDVRNAGSASNGQTVIDGIYIDSGGPHPLVTSIAAQMWHDVTYRQGRISSAAFDLFGSTGIFKLVNATIKGTSPTYLNWCRVGPTECYFLGGEYQANNYAFNFPYGGGELFAHGVDFSNNTTSLVFHYGSGSAVAAVHFYKCKMPAAWTFGVNIELGSSRLNLVEACDSAYQFSLEQQSGEIDFVTDVYYSSHDTLDDGISKGSFEYDTNSLTSKTNPLTLWVAMQMRRLAAINTEAASKKKVRIRFATATGYTLDTADVNFYAMAPYVDRDNCVYHRVSPLEDGSALSIETGAWTGPGLGTQYYFDLDLGSPQNGTVTVIPEVTKADVIVYFSWQLEFVA